MAADAFDGLECAVGRIAGRFSRLPAEKEGTNPTLHGAGLDLEANPCRVMAGGWPESSAGISLWISKEMNSLDDKSDQVPAPPEASGAPKRASTSWRPEELKLLGTMPDIGVARLLNRTQIAIRRQRQKLHIRAYHTSPRRWTPEEEQLLGTMSDERLARRLKRSVKTVRTRRAHKGIPVFNPKRHRWTAEDDKLLGLRPDAQVAMLLGISEGTVRRRRNQLHISLPGQLRKVSPRRPWPAEEDAMLGKATDAQVARRLGRSVMSVKTRRVRLGIASSRRR